MFSGLLLTSLSTALVRAALFQRKAKAGFLGELDELREASLSAPTGGVGDVVDADDIWTDLRDGGTYENPHEISSLYATDETPDDPAKAAARAKGRGKTKPRAEAPTPAEAPAAPAPIAPAAPDHGYAPPPPSGMPMHHDVPVMAPPTIGPAPIEDPGAPTFDPLPPSHEPLAPAAVAPQGTGPIPEADSRWSQPAPHPIRPEEMWHPADLVPTPLAGEATAPVVEERLSSLDLTAEERTSDGLRPFQPMDIGAVPLVEPVADHPGHELAQQLEAELVAAADPMIEPMTPAGGGPGLVAGPVGRRVRRDRPADRGRSVLPTAESVADAAPRTAPAAPAYDRGDTSPLPEVPLPPAALPTRPAARTSPVDPFGATPTPAVLDPSVGAPTSMPTQPVEAEPVVDPTPAVDQAAPVAPAEPPAAEVAPAPAPAAPEVTEPAFDPSGLVVEDVAPLPVASEPAASSAPAPAPAIPIPSSADRPLALAADGMVDVPGTIVRIGGARQAVATATETMAAISVTEGWCWVAPGDGQHTAVRITVPTAVLVVPAGAAALAVVEADRSTFVIVAYGTADLQGADGTRVLDRGAIAMLDPTGAAQFDHASDDEIDADPVVAENLALDAEL